MLKIFGRRKSDPRRELQRLLGDHELPNFPAIIMTTLEKVRDPEADSSAIADMVSSDPALSVRLLRTVNSAGFALRHRVKSIHHAVSLIGRSPLESMLISMAVREILPRGTGAVHDSRRFWSTAAKRAVTARDLAERIDPANRSESFTAALLQDMAIPLLAQSRPAEYTPVLEHWHATGDSLAALERGRFDWDHALVATWMCEKWKFPEHLVGAIGAHHGTGDESLVALPAVNLVATLREVDEEPGVEQLVETAHDHYGLAKDTTLDMVRSSFESSAEIARLFA